MKITIQVLIFLFTFSCLGQSERLQISSDLCMGYSFQFTRAQNLNDKTHRELMARHLNDMMFRIKARCYFNRQERLGLSTGINVGRSKYLQPIFQSHQGLGGYNETDESVEFSRNHFSVFAGLTYFIPLYDDFFRLQFSGHLAYNSFLNSNQVVQRDFKNYYSGISIITANRYEIEFIDRKNNFCFDLEVTMLFRLSKQLFLNVGVNYIGSRKFEYDYTYQFKHYNGNSDTWTPVYQHDNFLLIKQPRRIDHVFYIHTGISYAPKWKSSKNKEKQS